MKARISIAWPSRKRHRCPSVRLSAMPLWRPRDLEPDQHRHGVAALLEALRLEVHVLERVGQAAEELRDLLAAVAHRGVVEPQPARPELDLRVADREHGLDAGLAVAGFVERSEDSGQVAHVGEYATSSHRVSKRV